MNAVTVRVVGVIAAVIAVATVGLAAARATQPPDPSEIPIVVTSRPASSASTDTPSGALGSPDATPTILSQPEPVREEQTPVEVNQNESPGLQAEPGTTVGRHRSERGGDIVVPPVRNDDDDDDDHDDHDEKHDKAP